MAPFKKGNNMNFRKWLVASLLLGSVGAPLVQAGTFVATTTISVADIVPGLFGFTGGAQSSPPFSPISGVLAAGDTFDYTISFLPGQQLTINNLSFIWAFSYPAADSSSVNGTGTLSLLDGKGTALHTSNSKTSNEGSFHFGQQFAGSDFPGLPAVVSFSGLHYVGTLNSYAEASVTSRTYNNPGLFFNADSFSAGTIGTPVVPEPSSMVLFGGGALLLLSRKFSRWSVTRGE
jgi:hypothetical protein